MSSNSNVAADTILPPCHRPQPLPVEDLRLVASAGAGLLPELAGALREVFSAAAVLPCYGLTEW